MALPKSTPPTVTHQKGPIGTDSNLIHLGGTRWFGFHDGVPTGGDGWAGKGTVIVDYTNSDIYMNTNTLASPTWTKKVD